MAAPPPESAPNTPNALARSFESVNATVINDKTDGAKSAAKRPWRPRAAKMNSWLVAIPPSAEALAKPSKPTSKVRLRPQ